MGRKEGKREEKGGGRGLATRKKFLAPPLQITEEIVILSVERLLSKRY